MLQPFLAVPSGQNDRMQVFISYFFFFFSLTDTSREHLNHPPLVRWHPSCLEVLSEVCTFSHLSRQPAHCLDRLPSLCLVAPALVDGYRSHGQGWLASDPQHLPLLLDGSWPPEVRERQTTIEKLEWVHGFEGSIWRCNVKGKSHLRFLGGTFNVQIDDVVGGFLGKQSRCPSRTIIFFICGDVVLQYFGRRVRFPLQASLRSVSGGPPVRVDFSAAMESGIEQVDVFVHHEHIPRNEAFGTTGSWRHRPVPSKTTAARQHVLQWITRTG